MQSAECGMRNEHWGMPGKYCELHCKTNYSFLTGASHADELIERAIELEYAALAITDENTLAGVVRAYAAAREANRQIREDRTQYPRPGNQPLNSELSTLNSFKLIIGAEIIPNDAPPVVLWATDRKSYARLTRLLTIGRRRAPKGECWLSFADIAAHAEGLVAGVVPYIPGDRCRIGHIDATHPSYEWFSRGATATGMSCEAAAAVLSCEAAGAYSLGCQPQGYVPPKNQSPGGATDHAALKPGGPYSVAPSGLNDDNDTLTPGLHPGLHPVAATQLMNAQSQRIQSQRIQSQHSQSQYVQSQRIQSQHTLSCLRSLNAYRELFGDRAYLLAELYRGVDDAWRIDQLKRASAASGLPLVAAGDVLYHSPARLPLHDVLTATKHRTTVAQAGDLLLPNAQRHLQPIAQRIAAFKLIPGAIERTVEIADRCSFCLSQLKYEYPEELAPAGKTPLQYLRQLTDDGSRSRYPDGVPAKVQTQIEHELKLIDELRYEAYFLTVWDLVRFARQRGILCQGRGSAANSAVCYCLGVTSVDPGTTDLLFERFISKERDEAPDIDVDFEHERREEVLQYLYEKYGRDRAGLAATVITYRVRSAVRDVGKALGLSLDRVDALAKHVEGYSHDEQLAGRMRDVGIDPESRIGSQLLHLVNEIIGFPRHLSQHVGGMVITNGRLDELVPVENAAMDDRTVIQWDKNDLEELGLLKVDCLCLGMLTAIRKCFDLVGQHWGRQLTLATVPQEDPQVYDMICQADTVGVFQIESRGQMSMLPRLKPRCWYDLVIEVAIVRPGPIQGNMVHPYLRRRNGEEEALYPNEEIKAVLHRTLGVPIFQEQAMKLAVVAAGFTPGEADQLRRAMGAWRKTGMIEKFRHKLMAGMQQKGLNEEFAQQVFRQIRGFGEYGFPESHAASFALLVYVSAWLKHYYPAAFTAAIINSQPMGFYAPAQLIACARKHGVIVLPVDVNHSDWDCTLERVQSRELRVQGSEFRVQGRGFRVQSPSENQMRNAECGIRSQSAQTANGTADVCSSTESMIGLRLGLRMISGLREDHARTIIAARNQEARSAPSPSLNPELSTLDSSLNPELSTLDFSFNFQSIADFTRRTQLGSAVVTRLSQADAFGSLDTDRRAALWQALAQEKKPLDQPLFNHLEAADDLAFGLPPMPLEQQVVEDYQSVGLSLKAHPMSFHRHHLEQLQIVPTAELESRRNNQYLRVAGLVILRQRPSTAKGITFVTIEDETGTANLVVKQNIWERYYKIARRSPAWIAHGKLEKKSGVIHVVVGRLEDLSQRLNQLNIKSRDFR